MTDDKSKKEQILSLFTTHQMNPEEIGEKVGSTPSYVAKVLQDAGYLQNYFDLYTSTQHPINVYSRLFANRLGFKTKKIAQRSVNFLDQCYRKFKKNRDRTGQHHALIVALTMFNRALGLQKKEEASVFQQWLIQCLSDDL
jgi:hypothetical protein